MSRARPTRAHSGRGRRCRRRSAAVSTRTSRSSPRPARFGRAPISAGRKRSGRTRSRSTRAAAPTLPDARCRGTSPPRRPCRGRTPGATTCSSPCSDRTRRGHERLERGEVADDLARGDRAVAHDEVLGAADARHAVDRLVELEGVLAVVRLGDERRRRPRGPLARAEEGLAALDVDRTGVEDEALGEQRSQRLGAAAARPGLEVGAGDAGGLLGGAHLVREATRGALPAGACVMLRDVVDSRRATSPRADAGPATPPPPRAPAGDPRLDGPCRSRVGARGDRRGRVARCRGGRAEVADHRARGDGRARGRAPHGDAALALRRAPLGGGARRGLHAVGLVRPGAADRAGLAHPDGRHGTRAARAALRPVERHRDDGVRGGRARDQGPRPRGRGPARRRAHRDDRARRRGRDVTTFMPDPTWRRLSARMLLVHPVQEVIRAIPWLFGLLIAGSNSGRGGQWGLAGIGIAILAGVMRWFTTSYRITPEQVQLRNGLFRRRLRAVALDRVRTVDVTANLLHRILGLTRVTVGTGRSDGGADAGLRLDGLEVMEASTLRDELLHGRAGRPAAEAGAAAVVEEELARLQPAWIAYGPFTLSGLVTLGLMASFAANAVNDANVDPRDIGPLRDAGDAVGGLGPALAVVAIGAVLLVAVAVFSAAGYVLAYWGFRLTRRPEGTLHVVRGLITTRAVTIEERRLRGVEVSEPLLLRAVRGARCSAIATGLRAGRGRDRGGSLLVPPAPRSVVRGVAAGVLRTDEALTCPLTPHPPRARRRRYTRALAPCLPVVAAALALAAVLDWPAWAWLLALLPLPVAVALAADRVRSLGHAVTGTALVASAGSVVRRRSMLAREGIIGVNLSQSFFQRRAGLVTLTATTAAGDQASPVLDVTPDEAVRVAEAAVPALLAPFLEER